jgi:hypothetical protein
MKQIDAIALAREEKAVEQGMALLNTVYENGTKDTVEYHRNVFVLSYRLFHLGDAKGGLRILKNIPASYFRETLITQMKEDPNIAEIGRRIADILVMMGEARPKPTILAGPVSTHLGLA